MPYDKLNKTLTKYVLVSNTDPDFWLNMYESPKEVPIKDAFHGEVWRYYRREDGDFLYLRIIPGMLAYEEYFSNERIRLEEERKQTDMLAQDLSRRGL